jgi:hypothetical protein
MLCCMRSGGFIKGQVAAGVDIIRHEPCAPCLRLAPSWPSWASSLASALPRPALHTRARVGTVRLSAKLRNTADSNLYLIHPAARPSWGRGGQGCWGRGGKGCWWGRRPPPPAHFAALILIKTGRPVARPGAPPPPHHPQPRPPLVAVRRPPRPPRPPRGCASTEGARVGVGVGVGVGVSVSGSARRSPRSALGSPLSRRPRA